MGTGVSATAGEFNLCPPPPGAEAPGSANEGGSSPLRAWFTRLWWVSPMLERRAQAAARSSPAVSPAPACFLLSPSFPSPLHKRPHHLRRQLCQAGQHQACPAEVVVAGVLFRHGEARPAGRGRGPPSPFRVFVHAAQCRHKHAPLFRSLKNTGAGGGAPAG